jgi:hypothetical protein
MGTPHRAGNVHDCHGSASHKDCHRDQKLGQAKAALRFAYTHQILSLRFVEPKSFTTICKEKAVKSLWGDI